MTLHQIVLFVLLGVGPGALIAAIALSVVLNYRGDGVVNVAAGAMTAYGAYVYYGLEHGYLIVPPLPWVPGKVEFSGPVPIAMAWVITLLYCALIGLIIEFCAYRPLRKAPPVAKLAVSIGVLLTLQAVIVLRFGGNGQSAPNVLPTDSVNVLGSPIPVNRFILLGLVAAATAVLYSVYRFSSFGLTTRAAQENQDEAVLSGLSPNLMAAANTVLGAVLAGAIGIIVAPLTSLDPNTLTLAVVPALAAALLAGFTSFTIAASAGVALGVVRALVQLSQTQSWFPTTHAGGPIPGVPELIYFLAIVGILVLRGTSLPDRGTLSEARLPRTPVEMRLKKERVLAAGWCIGALMLVTFLAPSWRQSLINSLIGIVAALSLVVLTGYVAQISMAQIALAGLAGFLLSRLAAHAGIGFPFGPILAIAGATIVGTLCGAAALRVRGVQLAVVTLAAAVAISSFIFDNTDWGAAAGGSPVPSPRLFGVNIGPTAKLPFGTSGSPGPMMGYLTIAVLVPLVLLVVRLRSTRLGHSMLAVRSNERATAACGISAARVKLSAFAMSSAIVALAGVLISYNLGSVDPGRFTIMTMLGLIAFGYIGGITLVLGAVLAGLMTMNGVFTHMITSAGLPVAIQSYVGGILLIATIVTNPGGLALHPPWHVFRFLFFWRSRMPAAGDVIPSLGTDDSPVVGNVGTVAQ